MSLASTSGRKWSDHDGGPLNRSRALKRHARAGSIGAGVGLIMAVLIAAVDVAITPPQFHSSDPIPIAVTLGETLRAGHRIPARGPRRNPRPVRIDIDVIGVHAPVVPLGQARDGILGFPQPGPGCGDFAWYEPSPSPGEVGPAVLAGRVGPAQDGPSLYFRLGALVPGTSIRIVRADGSAATFRASTVTRYPHRNLPLEDLHGDIGPGLRLIACGADLDPQARHYLDDVVVHADLIAAPAPIETDD